MEANLLNDILLQYDMPYVKANLVRHNENMTYCIDDKYLLRIHKSKPGFNTAHFDNDVITMKRHENELEFLRHLHANGLYVQLPIKNIDDKLVTVHKDGTVATMLTWLPGRTLNKDDLTDHFGYDLGKMLGRMHRAAEGYYANEVIHYDQKLCQKLISFLSAYYNNGKLDKKYFESMSNALELIGDRLKQAESIFLHTDLSLSNILITDKGLVPIDFSLFGYSSPMLDFGSVFSFVNEADCRKSIIMGYEEVMGVIVNESEIDYYVAFQILLGIILHYELWVTKDWFIKRLPEWCCNNFDGLYRMV
ncbi:phosphotransferase [Bacillus sp. FJAT-49711]|uniref:phosphotransferase enzyme family protein n=1 Tax=Bacillus sp. FJAT-49711 TaxID=2833585 RepID=UPI001BC9F973|nr:phosphotransferase [Bacillus sp. FJAT-49711]MBS4220544.1 phosphotransferase [Bacillus sp. FJAT-49711]